MYKRQGNGHAPSTPFFITAAVPLIPGSTLYYCKMCIRDRFKIDADYDTVEWYGNGPAETYWDRQHGAKLGIYQNKVVDNMAQYLVPQECGAKTCLFYTSRCV